MKRIMIDMDDVICSGGFLAMVNEFLGTSYQEEDIKTYYIQDVIPQEKRKEWQTFFESKNLYDYTYIIPDAYEVMEKLSKKYEIYIVTAYIFRDNKLKSGQLLKNKFDYLMTTFPFIKPEQYVFTNSKEIIDCDIKIDDKVSNLKGNAETKLLFSAYHNRNINDDELKRDGITRVNNWKEIEKLLI